ncbi:hypothetical protein HKI87_03g19350 [Chloropicon roscoffensis]|uniref:Peptidylprolyl isomerase n=2 Tax=Chloropicon roscoffensis TaxID=1461544 RepID=A0AAX4P3P1_9CHLO
MAVAARVLSGKGSAISGTRGARQRAASSSSSSSSEPRRSQLNQTTRRNLLRLAGASTIWIFPDSRGPMGLLRSTHDAALAEEMSIPGWSLDELSLSDGWQASPQGTDLRYRVLRTGEGDKAAGVFDPPSAFKTFPFVAVTFACYNAKGEMFHGTDLLGKAEFSYQVGIRQGLEDEYGGVNQMVVGERRQFAFGAETVAENVGGGKVFGKKVAPQDVLVDVTLLSLRPY